MPDDALQAIRYALGLARDKGFEEVDLRFGDFEFHATLCPNGVGLRAPSQELETLEVEQADPLPVARAVEAPCVGIYEAGKQPLVVGRRVEKGEIVASIAALGLSNDVEAPESGEVVEVLVQPGQPVEFGQPLALLEVKP